MPKMDLSQSYRVAGGTYGPGKGVEVPEQWVASFEKHEQRLAEGGPGLPVDFPGREKLLAAGLSTPEAVARLSRDELLEIEGIGDKSADAIAEALSE